MKNSSLQSGCADGNISSLHPVTDVWERMRKSPLPLYLYGTGDGADKILDEMLSRKIQPAGIFVSEDFFRGQSFRGYPVTTLSRLEQDGSSFGVVVCFGSHLPSLLERIRDIAARHPLFVPDVPVAGNTLFDAAFYEAHRQELSATRALWADEASRQVFDQVIRYKLTGSLEALERSASPKGEALEGVLYGGIGHASIQSYVDCGAYRGDTIEEFLSLMGRLFPDISAEDHFITALEPDDYSFRKLSAAYQGRSGVRLIHGAVGSVNSKMRLSQGRGRGSRIMTTLASNVCQPLSSQAPSDEDSMTMNPGSKDPKNLKEINVFSLDSLSWPAPPTYIKMDVEGAEREAILGAEMLLQTFHPRLNIALYHRSEDLYALPLLIHELVPGYRLYLRRHPCFPCWDLNLYAFR